MGRLEQILEQLSASLRALEMVMAQEQLLLSAESVSGSALQRITEEKSSLLATLGYLEQQRQLAWSTAGADSTRRWQAMRPQLRKLSELNQHSGWLLEEQMAFNQQALALLRPHQEAGLYGKDGLAAQRVNGGVRFSV